VRGPAWRLLVYADYDAGAHGAAARILGEDVSESDWFYGDVKYAYVNGLMTGVSATEFAPNAKLSRAMLVTVLFRYAKEQWSVGSGQWSEDGGTAFTDVPAGRWYSDAIAWAAANGSVTGVGDNKFAPDEYITREQFATILFRFATSSVGNGRPGSVAPTGTNISDFVDVDEISSWALDAVKWSVSAGLINGIGGGKVAPLGEATRAEAAALLRRYIENVG
jgi:hypothetical protein